MKRTLVAIAVLGSLAVGFLAPGSTNAVSGPPLPPAPKKVDPKVTAVTGGNPWPLGLNGTYGFLRLTFPSPLVTEKLTSMKVTCTPAAGTGADLTQYPDFILEKTFALTQTTAGVSAYASGTDGFSNTGGNISLVVGPYADPDNTGAAQYPSLKCGVTVYNAKKPAGVAGKAQKVGAGPAANCGDADVTANPLFPGTQGTPTAVAGKTTLYMPVTIDAGIIGQFPYCTTGTDARARFLSDQKTDFTYSAKATNKKGVRTGLVKKLKLTAPLNHEIPLVVSGSTVVYKFDKTAIQLTSCTASVAKNGTNSCAYNNTTGTITLTSTESVTIKKDKPIISPTIDFTFNVIGAIGSTATITYSTSATSITIGPATVAVKLMDYDAQLALLGLPPAVSPDPNAGYPLITLTLP